MYAREDELTDRMCMLLIQRKPGIAVRPDSHCIGSRCFTYWRWKDETQQEGYCAAAEKPIV